MSDIKRVLLFTAHADDCEFFAGGTVAKLIEAGAEVTEVICTDNGRGSFELETTELVSQSRYKEAHEAAKIMGKKEVVFLGHPDGYLDEFPKNKLRGIFMEWVRKVKPDLVMSFDPFAPFESHPDHRHVSWAAIEAVGFAHLPLYHPEQIAAGLETWKTPVCYWFAKNDSLAEHVEDISSTIDKKIEALCVQKSQMRMTIQDMKMSIKVSGKNEHLLPFLDEDNYEPALEMMIKTWAQGVGERAGYEYGECFRVEEAGEIFGKVS